ncbi:hypothetical protein F2P56_001165 [Juglans regia]|uniref:Retrotransposon Copia-like N-terminal domain-containing protein n=1 Tax=Juglans regia TaxID=51240 RepID=A0A833YCB0_JUGRE|nr:hypothetical protein F2P56_001165 [Juglans regia]
MTDSTPPVPQNQQSLVEDSYYLHHGENPGLMLVSQQLNGDNYPLWARAMSKALSAKNKMGFVNGTLKKPAYRSDPKFSAWERCNDMVLSWIINSVTKNIASSILYIDVAADVWKDLQEHFSQRNRPRIFQLKKAISSLTQEQQSVSDYFTQLKAYWDELANYRQLPQCTCGIVKKNLEFQQEEYIMQFLMGLNDSFTSIRGQILLLDPLPSMNQVFSLVVQEEKQREIKINSAPSFDSVAAMTTKIAKNGNAFNRQSGTRKERPICSHCGYAGHTSDKCYRIHGFPPGFKSKKSNVHSANQVSSSPTVKESNDVSQLSFTQEQRQQILALINPSLKSIHKVNQVSTLSTDVPSSSGILPTTNIPYSENISGKTSSDFTLSENIVLASVNSPSIPWIIDTGATDHMVCSTSFFSSIKSHVSSSVKLPNNNLVLVTHIGTVTLSNDLILHNVLCVPSFSYNLISARPIYMENDWHG